MDKTQLRELIQVVLKEYDLYSRDAEELLMLTAAVESNLGYYIKQVGGGPALGIFQCEPDTLDWVKKQTEIMSDKKYIKFEVLCFKNKKSASAILLGKESGKGIERSSEMKQYNKWYQLKLGIKAFKKSCFCSTDFMLDLKVQILSARLVYYFKTPKAIPNHNDVQGLAEYWKKYYNSVLGAGTVEGAIEKYNKYVK